MQTVGWLCGKIKAASATKAAALRGVEVVPLSAYHHGRMAREGLQLGFAAVDTKEIRRGAHELAIALETVKSPTKKNLTENCRQDFMTQPSLLFGDE